MKVFGYSNKKKIFTIWELSYTYEEIDSYRRYKIENYKYLGRTIEEPESLFENVMNRLRSFTKKNIEFTNDDTFRFGKYAGRKITEVKDLKYTKWYFEIVNDPSHKKFVKDYLYDNWYEFKTNFEGNEYAISPKTVDKWNKEKELKKEHHEKMLEMAKKGKKVFLEITSNPKEDGKIIIDGVVYYFPKVVSRYYKGYRYFMPVTNGKAKRIKNKVIEANLFELDNEIFISNFKIVK